MGTRCWAVAVGTVPIILCCYAVGTATPASALATSNWDGVGNRIRSWAGAGAGRRTVCNSHDHKNDDYNENERDDNS